MTLLCPKPNFYSQVFEIFYPQIEHKEAMLIPIKPICRIDILHTLESNTYSAELPTQALAFGVH